MLVPHLLQQIWFCQRGEGKLFSEIALYCSWFPWEKVVAPLQGTSHPFPGRFWPHSSLRTEISLLCPRTTAPHPFLRRWAAKPACRMAPANGSAPLSYGPLGSVGKQVQIDYLWDKCLLKEQGKARGNYFLSWCGEKNIVTRLEPGRAQQHMWACGMSMDLGCSKTEVLRCAYINPNIRWKGHVSLGA